MAASETIDPAGRSEARERAAEYLIKRHRFRLAETLPWLAAIAVYFIFQQESRIEIGSELFRFEKGDSIRLFFSCRHTPQLLDSLLNPLGLTIIDHWINSSGEEGVFLVKRES